MRIEQKLAIPLVIIAIGNLLKSYMYNDPLLYYFLYGGFFILIAIGIQFVKLELNGKYYSMLMILFSLASAIPSDMNSLNVAFFFLSSLLIYRFNKKIYWGYGLLISVLLIARFDYIELKSSSTINYIAAISFITIIFQYYIFPKPTKKILHRDPDKVPYIVVDIMELRIKGFRNKEIPDELGIELSEAGVGQKLKRCRDSLNIASNEGLALYLEKNNYICLDNDRY